VVLAAIESSSRPATVALAPAGPSGPIVERELGAERAHASDLLPTLDALLEGAGLGPRDLTGLVVGLGPGSYTGLRVGLATALGLARGLALPLRGLASCEALAWGELRPGEECVFLLDARQGALYHARYRRGTDDVVELEPPRALPPAEAARRTPAEVVLFADAPALESAGLGGHAGLRAAGAPRARALLELGRLRLARLGPQDPRTVQPLYLRAFDARVRRR
jgi:tRNA threonylcarbamoyladenosine biosynthesis protein TsaB